MPASKRILLLSYSFNTGGSEVLCVKIAKHLKKSGHDVRVIATHTGEGVFSETYDSLGIPNYALNNDECGKWKTNVKMLAYLAKWKPDIVHAQHVGCMVLLYWPLKMMAVRKLYVTEHTNFRFQEQESFHNLAYKYLPKMSGMTVIHQGLVDYFGSEFDIKPENMHLIYNGLDTNRFKPSELDKEKEAKDIVIGWVGRLAPTKNFPRAAEIIRKLVDRLPEYTIKVAVVGEGPLEDDARKAVIELGLQEVFEFRGVRSEVEKELLEFDLYLMSSNQEGVPFTMLEAQSCGLPVVVPDVGGIKYFIENQQNGFMYPDGDVDTAVDYLERLIKDPLLRERIGGNARQFALDHYEDDKNLAKYEELFLSGI